MGGAASKEVIRNTALRKDMASTLWATLSEYRRQIYRDRYRLHERSLSEIFLPLPDDSILDMELKFALWTLKFVSLIYTNWDDSHENAAKLILQHEKNKHLQLAQLTLALALAREETEGDDANVKQAKGLLNSTNNAILIAVRALKQNREAPNHIIPRMVQPLGFSIFEQPLPSLWSIVNGQALGLLLD